MTKPKEKVTEIALQKGLPMSEYKELTVLASCLHDKDHLETALSKLDATDFAKSKHRILFTHMRQMHERGEIVDNVTVYKSLAEVGRITLVGDLISQTHDLAVPRNLKDLETYCSMLKEISASRLAITRIASVQEALTEGGSAADAASRLQAIVEEVMSLHGEADDLADMHEIYSESGDFRSYIGMGQQVQACPIPWRENLGGLRQGELTILAARPGGGKSSAAAQIAVHTAKHGMGVHFWSLEMTGLSIHKRMAAENAQVSHYKLTRGYLNEHEQKLAYSSVGEISALPIMMSRRGGSTSVDRVRSALVKARAQGKCPSLVVIDYLQLMDTQGGSSRNDQVGKTARKLKELTLEFPVSLLVLSQLSRDSDKEGGREPKLSDLRDSGEIEAHSDNCVFIHRTNQDDESKVLNVSWICRKQRNGRTGMVPLLFHRDLMRFSEVLG